MEETVRRFVPVSDELLYQSDAVRGPLVPYRCGLPCWHQLRDAAADGPAEDVADDDSDARAGREVAAVSA
jgi:hypothetical protein